jgi:hypothetical protein
MLAEKVRNHKQAIAILRVLLDKVVYILQAADMNNPATKTITDIVVIAVDKVISPFIHGRADKGLIPPPDSLSFRDFNRLYQDGKTGDEPCCGINENTKR